MSATNKAIGLTGGIASGKTAVTRRFEALGIVVADADLAAEKNQQHQHQVRNTPDDGGVRRAQPHPHRATREFGPRAQQPQDDGDEQGRYRHPNGQYRTLQDG